MPSMEISISVGRWVASASTVTVVCSWPSRPPGAIVAGQHQRDVDGDLLAAADREQVDVLELAADRVPLDGLGDGQLVLAVDGRASAARSAAVLDRVAELPRRQRHMHRVGAVAVDHGRGSCRPGGYGERRPCRNRYVLRRPRRTSATGDSSAACERCCACVSRSHAVVPAVLRLSIRGVARERGRRTRGRGPLARRVNDVNNTAPASTASITGPPPAWRAFALRRSADPAEATVLQGRPGAGEIGWRLSYAACRLASQPCHHIDADVPEPARLTVSAGCRPRSTWRCSVGPLRPTTVTTSSARCSRPWTCSTW